MTTYELASGDEPVTVEVKGSLVTVALGSLVLTYDTHRDADGWDERHELIGALRGAERPIIEAVDRVKLTQARDQAMLVLYAKHHNLPMSEAVTALKLEWSRDQLKGWGEWTAETGKARAAAGKYLAAALREHQWTQVGPEIGPPPQKKARVVDLDTGEMVETFPVQEHSGMEWRDVNGMTVEEGRAGAWWLIVGAVRELPWNPWIDELEQVTGH